MPSNHLILCRPLLLLPSTFPSIRVFSNESVLHIRWPFANIPSWTSPKEIETTVYCYASHLVWGIICFITIYNYYNFSTRPGTGPLLQIEGPAQPITANVHQDSWWAGLFGNPFQVRAHLKRVDVHLEGLAQSHDHVGSLSCRMLPS